MTSRTIDQQKIDRALALRNSTPLASVSSSRLLTQTVWIVCFGLYWTTGTLWGVVVGDTSESVVVKGSITNPARTRGSGRGWVGYAPLSMV